MTRAAASGHIAQGELVRLLHGELGSSELDAALAHLDSCAVCAERRAQLEQRFILSGEKLVQITPELDDARRAQAWAEIQRAALRKRQSAHRGRQWSGFARAAAVGAALFTAAFAAEPVRAFVADAWQNLFGSSAEVAAEEPAHAPLRVRNSVVGFVPTAPEFTLELSSTQHAGTLSLLISPEETTASARISSDDEMNVVVLPSGMRIENEADFTADYRVTVPGTIETVVVRVSDATSLRLDVRSLDLPWSGEIRLSDASLLPTGSYPIE
jgi:hypothetical protein